jgi:hypothetical protein
MVYEPPKRTTYLHDHSIDFYIKQIEDKNYFSIAGYSDAEWYCMLGIRQGDKTGLGQTLDKEHGKKLLDVMKRRQHTSNFLFAIPRCLWYLPHFSNREIEDFLADNDIHVEFYERDRVTDTLAENAGLFPFINQLQSPTSGSIVIIGNKHLRHLRFLKYRRFIEISTPNFHLEDGLEAVIQDAVDYGQPGVYLVSAGVSAAVIIDRLHDEISNSFFIDCGSIWDAFVGIGGQRTWRANLFANPMLLRQWKKRNLYGNYRAHRKPRNRSGPDRRSNR